MIPRKAHFYWYGDGPLPALRQLSVSSFKAVNPDWDVHVHRSGEDPKATLRERIVRSDAARYGILHRAGGVYLDTDIVFVRPIPELWLTKDALLPISYVGEMYGVHVLGASEGCELFRHAMWRAELRMDSKRALGCQSLGVKLWEGTNIFDLAASMNLDVVPVPIAAFLSVAWRDVEDLWSPNGEIDPNAIGLHWYGGDPLSREYEHAHFDELPDCLIRKALEMSRVAV